MNGKRLSREFYQRDTIEVARHLIGKVLVHKPLVGVRVSGRIVETEAYLGADDPAAHSFGGRRTARTEPMFGKPGLSYIYFIYGSHYCFNVVTADEGTPEAVLVRALEPLEGIDFMESHRMLPKPTYSQLPKRVCSTQEGEQTVPFKRKQVPLANGPGKLCAALGLGRGQNALDLCEDPYLWIEDSGFTGEIVDGPRVGIGYEQDHIFWPLRFGLKNSPFLSRPKFELELGHDSGTPTQSI